MLEERVRANCPRQDSERAPMRHSERNWPIWAYQKQGCQPDSKTEKIFSKIGIALYRCIDHIAELFRVEQALLGRFLVAWKL